MQLYIFYGFSEKKQQMMVKEWAVVGCVSHPQATAVYIVVFGKHEIPLRWNLVFHDQICVSLRLKIASCKSMGDSVHCCDDSSILHHTYWEYQSNALSYQNDTLYNSEHNSLKLSQKKNWKISQIWEEILTSDLNLLNPVSYIHIYVAKCIRLLLEILPLWSRQELCHCKPANVWTSYLKFAISI